MRFSKHALSRVGSRCAALKKSMDSMGKHSGFGVVWTSSADQPTRIPSFDPVTLRFTENRTLKTEHPEQRCQLRFPYGTGRSPSNGLLEQMPCASARRALIATTPLRSTLTVTPHPRSQSLNGLMVLLLESSVVALYTADEAIRLKSQLRTG